MKFVIPAVLAGAIAGGIAVVAAQAPASAPFQIVTTPTYEGAIVPGPGVPAQLRPDDASGTWTPTAMNVAAAERQLTVFLQRSLKEAPKIPEQVQAAEDLTMAGLSSVIAELPKTKRQYMGFLYGPSRRMLIYGRPDDESHQWRLPWRIALEGSCRFWWYEYSVTDDKVLSFNCQGIN